LTTVLATLDKIKRLQGLWLYLARGFWLVTAAVMLVVFVIASVHIYQFYLTPCATWTVDLSCERVVRFLTTQGFGVRWLAFVNVGVVALAGLSWMIVAYLVFAQRGYEVSGWVLSLALLTGWASDLTNANVRHHVWWALQGTDLGSLPHALVYFISFISQATVVMLGYLLPDGRFTPRWTLYFAGVWFAYMIIETLYRYPFLAAPGWFIYPETFFTFAAPLSAGFALHYRYRTLKRSRTVTSTQEEQKRQLETVLPSVICLVATYSFMTLLLFVLWRMPPPWISDTLLRYSHDLLQNVLQAVCAVWFILSLAVAVFRHQLFSLELAISRTLVYGGVSLALLALYVTVVFGVGYVFHQQTFWVSLLATSLVALLFQPLRERLQRQVNRRFYGQRDEPFEVMRQLGEQVQSLHPQDMLPGLVMTLQETFRLPYVAITIYNSVFSQGSRTIREGTPGKHVLRFPLVASEEVGILEVSPRSYETLSQREEKLLETIAKEIAVAARSLRLSLELQGAREHLVGTREEERRRLQRDLHDGLGPTLAAQTLKIGVARSLLQHRPEEADKVLSSLEEDSRGTLEYVRQLVYSLRPPLLDQLGLKGALEQQLGEQLLGQKLRLNLSICDLPVLPAAAEVASYFIITEAVHNVLRHAGATCCEIRVSLLKEPSTTNLASCQDKLELVICDDGEDALLSHQSTPVPVTSKPFAEGLGLSSMRERCEELGGTLEVRREQGFCIRAVLPLLIQTRPLPGQREPTS
jgi:signal transduction histidine kinase